ncbi:aminopeptidase [Chryseobacterium flavum]|uniref:Aminopeptidase n=1 Tax=Chryseobacterium flavum TaxID=415851 RepID=A0A3D9CGV9_9FLAO|nr:M1 family aminopeptidase [Chryseobacterium flavum]REC64988.1 aminopeptidase [Chryseobacterium flavum]
MNTIFLFEAKRSVKHWPLYLIAFILLCTGIFCGNQFNLSPGEGIFLNSPYTIGLMTGLLSLSIIFFGCIYALQLLFRDYDSKFDLILYSFPFSKGDYLKGKFLHYFLQTFLSFSFLMAGFIIGQNIRTGSEIQEHFSLGYYVYTLFIFGAFNSILVCSLLFCISFTVKKKLLTVAGGLLLYILYTVIMLFSNSPFMAGSIPQSPEAQQLSALIDPFGLSSYFFDARAFTIDQKNASIVPLTDYLLFNRILFLIISGLVLLLTFQVFSFSNLSGSKVKKTNKNEPFFTTLDSSAYTVTSSDFGKHASFRAVVSFAKIDLMYLFKSIALPAVVIMLLFFVGMEMYAEIEKGIRLPQKYAGSGLMATTISENFPLFGLLLTTYFLNDLYWRSYSSGFVMIEKSTFFSTGKLTGHLISISTLLFFFTGILIIQGLVFQFAYQYFHIDWNAYMGVSLFNTFPLILFSAFLLVINDMIRNKFIALGVSVLSVFMLAGPLSGKVLSYPLFRIFSDFKGSYSDFNGYGIYAGAFAQRLLFGTGIIAVVWMLNKSITIRKIPLLSGVFSILLLFSGIFAGTYFMKGYAPKNDETAILNAVQYEKKFRQYENLPQPDITDVITEIHLYPSENAYEISGRYILKNQTEQPINKILFTFHDDVKLKSAVLTSGVQKVQVTDPVMEVVLKKPMNAGAVAVFNFKFSYRWYAINGHQSFNAIINNGSFMRISRYYPAIGYQKYKEVEDLKIRKDHHLGKLTALKKPEAPELFKNDFINLDMTVSTEKKQYVAGTGDLLKKWTRSGRNYFRYKAQKIPFRFALSSAEYHIKNVNYKGIIINILYHKKHFENVDHLVKNAEITLDYCQQNFGKYPFKTITFAEISSYTRGFAATAYPSAIFMPEDMIFHANIHADQQQDVINELAGHELSHLWWGSSQIDPDHEREGDIMLTETLAMYTEMMLYKKMHGTDKMMERIKMHQQIYDNEKGLSENMPVYKATGEVPHISYSKGAVVMVKLSEYIGENNVNKALRNFLRNNQYPKKPASADLLNEFYKVAPDTTAKKYIDNLFKTTEGIPSPPYSKNDTASSEQSEPVGSF